MAYSRTNWTDNEAPYLNATNLNKIEDGIYNNGSEISSVESELKTDIANNATKISNNTTNISANAVDIANNADSIASNKTDIDINAGNILGLSVGEVYQGTWTPEAGTEYPASPEGGWSYYIQFLDDDGYEFVGGDLAGRIANNGDKIIYNGTAWSMIDNTNDMLGYYLVDDVSSMLSLSPLHGAMCQTYGYYTANDGGGGTFNFDASLADTNNGGTILDGWVRQYSGAVNVKWFGAKGDFTSYRETTDAIQSAVEYMNSVGGGTLFFPSGTYGVTKTSLDRYILTPGDEDYCLHFYGSNIEYLGENGTVIKGTDITPQQQYIIIRKGKLPVINGEIAYSESSFNKIHLDGGRTPVETDPIEASYLLWYHSYENSSIRNSKFTNSAHYGIGCQNGGVRFCIFDSIVIENTLTDGIDFKNNGNVNEGNMLSNIIVINFGVGVNEDTPFAGIDIMGTVTLSNITVSHFSNFGSTGYAGVRFKQGELADDRGLGGHGSSISNFNIESSSTGTFDSACGIVSNAYNIDISNGTVKNSKEAGIKIIQENVSVSNVNAIDCDIGFYSTNGTFTTDGDSCVFNNLIAENSSEYAFRTDSKFNTVTNLTTSNCVGGVYVSSNGEDTIFESCDLSTVTGVKVRNTGANTLVSNTRGFTTFTKIQSSDTLIDAIGTQTVQINHLFEFTPQAKDVTLTAIRSANNQSMELGFIRVSGVSSSVVNAQVSVTQASTLAGDTMSLGFTIDSRYIPTINP